MDYNWDDLEIGSNLKSPMHFFGTKHNNHERELRDELPHTNDDCDKENAQNSTNIGSLHISDSEETPKLIQTILNENFEVNDKKAAHQTLVTPLSAPAALPLATLVPAKPLMNTAKKGDSIAIYNYAQYYESKKQKQRKQVLDEQRKQREFHSKPAPNFNALHRQITLKNEPDVKVTIPKPPKVFYRGMETLGRRNKTMEDLKTKPLDAHKFIARKPTILNEKPFKPNLDAKIVLTMEPFDLHSSRRGEERKMYDQKIQLELEHRKKQELQDLQRQEIIIRKEIRKQSSFKARPNPFK